MMFKGANPLQDNYNGGRNVVSFMDYIKKTVDVQASTGKAPALKTQWHQVCFMRGLFFSFSAWRGFPSDANYQKLVLENAKAD